MNPTEGGAVASAHEMGVRRVGSALKQAQGTMKQKAFAKRWNLPVGTLRDLQQGKVRNYGAATLNQFDVVLGGPGSTVALYEQPDEEPATQQALEQLRTELEALRATVEQLQAGIAAGLPARAAAIETLIGELGDDEISELVAYAHFMRMRRERNRLTHGLPPSDRP